MRPSSETNDSLASLFEEHFTVDNLLSIRQESNKYAVSKVHLLQVDFVELMAFIGMLLVRGYVQLPGRQMFWLASDGCHNAATANCMTWNWFNNILTFLGVADNNALEMKVKFSKMRPLFDGLKRRQSLDNFRPKQALRIYESMIPYSGKDGAKQYIHGKPIKLAYKIWVIATPGDYSIQFYPYQEDGTSDNVLGIGGSRVIGSRAIPIHFWNYQKHF